MQERMCVWNVAVERSAGEKMEKETVLEQLYTYRGAAAHSTVVDGSATL